MDSIKKLIEYVVYLLPVRYWYHCHVSVRPTEYEKWKRGIMGWSYRGDNPGEWRGSTIFDAFVSYRPFKVWKWIIFTTWFWKTLPVVWKHRDWMRKFADRYWQSEGEMDLLMKIGV